MGAALYDSISRIARHEAEARAVAGVGVVTNVYPADGSAKDYAVTVKMRDTGLVLPRVPVASGPLGFAAIPGVDELVVVLFMYGDHHAPVVVGRLYHPDQEPPEHREGEIVLALPSGDPNPKLLLKINGGEPSIKVEMPDGEVTVEITDGKVGIAVGELHVNVDGSGGGRAEIAAGGSTITLKKDGDIKISAQGNLTLEANKIEISGAANVKITGGTVDIN